MDRRRAAQWRPWGAALMRAGGVLVAAGSVLPWAYVPAGDATVPVPGLLAGGALTLLAGAWLVWRPRWWLAAFLAPACLYLAGRSASTLAVSVKKAMFAMQGRVEPLNELLARFGLAPIVLFDTGVPLSALRGPGVFVVLGGAVVALAGAVVAGTAAGATVRRRCTVCGRRAPRGRLTAYCVGCGASMPGERACAACFAMAEPGDIHCGRCGQALSGG